MRKLKEHLLHLTVWVLSIFAILFTITIVSAQDALVSASESESIQTPQLDSPDFTDLPEESDLNTGSEPIAEYNESFDIAQPSETPNSTITPEPTATAEPAILKQQAIHSGSVSPAVAPESLTDSDLISVVSYDSLDQISQLSSSHPYMPNTSSIIKFTLPGAVHLRIRFGADFNLEYGYDSFAIYQFDPQTNTFRLFENKTFTGTDLAGQEIDIIGDMVLFRFEADSSIESYGWQIADIQARFPEPATEPESINTETSLE